MRRHLAGFVLPVVTAVVLVVLLIIALSRLAQIQQDTRSNNDANMLWVLSQTQATVLRSRNAMQDYRAGSLSDEALEQAFALLDSRLSLLRAGPQARVVAELDASGKLANQIEQLNDQPLLADMMGHRQAASHVLTTLDELDQALSRAANKAMVAQWERQGARLDRYRDSVLAIIFIMIGICLCSMLITASLFLALKRVREAEWLKRRSVQLQGTLDAERKLGELHKSFNAMISHQFRTPLAIIDTSMQRLLRSAPPLPQDFVHRHATKTRRAAARLSRVVDHSLLAEQYAQGLDMRLRPCSLESIVDTAIAEEKSLSAASHITREWPETPIDPVVCDPVLAEHIIGNLLSNAVKFSEPGSPVVVRFGQTSREVFCEVVDQGMGIHESSLPQLFQRFFRTPQATSIEGTGMGLFVAWNLLVLQSGTLTVQSVPGKGSVFRAGFPRATTKNQEGGEG